MELGPCFAILLIISLVPNTQAALVWTYRENSMNTTKRFFQETSSDTSNFKYDSRTGLEEDGFVFSGETADFEDSEMFWVVNNTELEIGDTAILHFGNLTQRQGCISLMFGATNPIVFAFYFEYKANEDTEFTSIQGRIGAATNVWSEINEEVFYDADQARILLEVLQLGTDTFALIKATWDAGCAALTTALPTTTSTTSTTTMTSPTTTEASTVAPTTTTTVPSETENPTVSTETATVETQPIPTTTTTTTNEEVTSSGQRSTSQEAQAQAATADGSMQAVLVGVGLFVLAIVVVLALLAVRHHRKKTKEGQKQQEEIAAGSQLEVQFGDASASGADPSTPAQSEGQGVVTPAEGGQGADGGSTRASLRQGQGSKSSVAKSGSSVSANKESSTAVTPEGGAPAENGAPQDF